MFTNREQEQLTTTSSRARQRSFVSESRFKRDLKTNLNSKNEKAAPRKVAGPARRKPLIPQAKPQTDTRVVKPTRGGTEETTTAARHNMLSWRVCADDVLITRASIHHPWVEFRTLCDKSYKY